MSELGFLQKFRARLCLLVVLLVVPAFGLVLSANLTQRRIQTAAIQDSTRDLSRLVAANQQDMVKNARQLLGTLTQFPFLVLSANPAFCEVHFANLLKLSPDYVNFGLIETNGQLFCNGAKTNAIANLADRTYFQRVLASSNFSIGDFQIGRLTAAPSLNFAYPVLDSAGALRRVLFASLNLSKLSEAVANVHLPAGGTILVTDSNGNVLAHQPEPQSWVGKSLGHTPVVAKVLAQKESVFVMPGVDGIPRLHAVTPISDGQSDRLFVCVSVPLSVSMAQAEQALLRNCVVLAVVALIVLAAAWFYSQQFFLRPVNSLVTAARALAAGDLKARTGPMEGAAELVQLGFAFDEMARRLEERQAELLQLNQALRAEIVERQRAEQRILDQSEERRLLEQQLFRAQRMESLGALAGGIAHDLNNALAPILMGSGMLRQEHADDRARLTLLDLIENSAQRCTQMVKQILNFAKGSRGHTRSLPVAQLIDEMVKIANDTFPKSITISSSVPKNLLNIAADPTELHQVLMNLCVNARDAMANGGRLTLTARPVALSPEQQKRHSAASSGPYVLLSIADTGTGMAPETMKRIFEPFFTTKSPDKGTGLGLSTVATIVKKHHGFIEVQSRLGQGTVFDIFLPALASKTLEAPTAKRRPASTGRGELILVVDDEQFVLELAKTTLEESGYQILTARNGLEAIACVEAQKANLRLLLTDTDMPFLDGMGAIAAIQKITPHLPIIVSSGMPTDLERIKSVDASRIATLAKPYGVEELLEAVGRVLARP